jgi:hypothetical protein
MKEAYRVGKEGHRVAGPASPRSLSAQGTQA